MEIGNNLKILRKRLKKSQEEVAQDLKLTRSTYSGYENGVAQPNLENIVAFSDYFKVPIDDLIRKDFEKYTNNTIQLEYTIPPINLNHIKNMTTNFGMIQFSKIAQPDKLSGYTLDDNARALIAMCQHFEIYEDESDLILIETYLEFIKYWPKIVTYIFFHLQNNFFPIKS